MSEETTTQDGLFITTAQVRAVNVLLAAAQVAQKAGAFSLADAKAVFEAIEAFKTSDAEAQTEEPAA